LFHSDLMNKSSRIISVVSTTKQWGKPPWTVDFCPPSQPLPDKVNVAVIGGGFTGLSAAARLAKLAPPKNVAVFEAEVIGAGSSGHTGGMALAETAAGAMPGLGDVLTGMSGIIREFEIDCDFSLRGVWELGRSGRSSESPIQWRDSGELRVVSELPGGSVDPGKLVSGLARAATRHGAVIHENARVEQIRFDNPLAIRVNGKEIRADHVLLGTNAESLELSALAKRAEPKFTLALATGRLTKKQLVELGLESGRSFYTEDLPYLWGRIFRENRLIFGSGLVGLSNWRDLLTLNISNGEAARLMKRLEHRIRRLHRQLRDVKVTHRWGGPILIGKDWQPVFSRHPKSDKILVLGAYSGHGVALSVYLGSWAAEVILNRRELPDWPSALS
jgi:glycine/D-amino acid oxidase-like deaminating enzyme